MSNERAKRDVRRDLKDPKKTVSTEKIRGSYGNKRLAGSAAITEAQKKAKKK